MLIGKIEEGGQTHGARRLHAYIYTYVYMTPLHTGMPTYTIPLQLHYFLIWKPFSSSLFFTKRELRSKTTTASLRSDSIH